MRKVRMVLSSIAIITLVMASPASAHASVLHDPTGDIAAGLPAYLDLVKAKIHATDTTMGRHEPITFTINVAAPIPELSASTFFAANWLLDTVPGGNVEYNLIVRWCSRATHPQCQVTPAFAHWEAAVRDFGKPPADQLTFFTTFKVEGDTVTLSLDPESFGGATEFGWFAAIRNAPGGATLPVDIAPGEGLASFSR